MVGNATDAAFAVALYEAGDTDIAYPYFLGAGCSRHVYLVNGVAYKVNTGGFQDNEDEFHTANHIRGIMATFNVVVPEVSMFGDVLAMEYIDGELTGECWSPVDPCDCPDKCLSDGLVANLTHFGWHDAAYGNAMWHEGTLYLIDLA
jgi:hypothetical protein